MIDNKITIKDDEKVNIQRGAIGHRSTWTGLTYKYAGSHCFRCAHCQFPRCSRSRQGRRS